MNLSFARRQSGFGLGVILVLCVLPAEARGQLVLGEVDTFETSLEGWHAGDNSPAPPTIAANAGPGGSGDNAMQLTAIGGNFAGRNLVAINTSQWTGNYISQGVYAITLDFRNTGPTALTMRLAFRDPSVVSPTWFVTNLGYDLPAGSNWQNARFNLAESDVSRVQGTQSFANTFASVAEIRLLHNTALDFRGQTVVASLLVDNISAVPEPEMSAVVLALSAVAATVCLRRRRSASVQP
jgi:hypothetical protein